MSRITAFLSSTYSDLKEHRRAVAEALESLKITVECMERFTADPREPVDVCTDEISDCDVFIGIYAHRYGYVLPGTEESITERELQHARRENKPIFCFLVQDEYPWAPHFIDDGQNKTQLQKLKRAIDSRMVRGTFTSPDHLAREVTAAVSNYLTQGRYEPDGDEIRIERILNHDDPDLLAALGLMLKRIPEDERFDPEDVVRWLREDQVESSQRDSPRRHYFVVARTRSRVLGFTLLHCFPEEQLAFIAYLVGTKEIRLGRGDVSTRLYQSVV
ncbi:MAG: DUF4062 domain-containing protein, partial [Planctomycetaceae bacterium]|nr:DUF4062 domain-containing protein [Planctomycetaceae bacterium]